MRHHETNSGNMSGWAKQWMFFSQLLSSKTDYHSGAISNKNMVWTSWTCLIFGWSELKNKHYRISISCLRPTLLLSTHCCLPIQPSGLWGWSFDLRHHEWQLVEVDPTTIYIYTSTFKKITSLRVIPTVTSYWHIFVTNPDILCAKIWRGREGEDNSDDI